MNLLRGESSGRHCRLFCVFFLDSVHLLVQPSFPVNIPLIPNLEAAVADALGGAMLASWLQESIVLPMTHWSGRIPAVDIGHSKSKRWAPFQNLYERYLSILWRTMQTKDCLRTGSDPC